MKNLLKSVMMTILLLFSTATISTQVLAEGTVQTEENRELKLSKDNKMFLGVASGIGEHLNVDPNLVRLGFILLSLTFGVGLITYLIAYVIMM